MTHRLPAYTPTLAQGDPVARLLLRTLGTPRVQDEFADLRDRSPGRSVDLTEAEEFEAVRALTSQRVTDAFTELRASEVIRLEDPTAPGVYVGR